MSEIIKKENLPGNLQSEDAYLSIRGYAVDEQRQVYSAVNAAMVTAYWNIGKAVYEVCGESDRAIYDKQILKYIDHLQKFLLELGRGFSFVARQKHFNFDGRHFYIDLVFYNYILNALC